ncbi:MAG: LysR substrate-binding domain-containing protein [Casimicrobiaceae bacterium]
MDFLKGFDAAARHLSFTRAAEEMHLTQSALSRQVRTLEDEIGVPLFARGRRGLSLTPAGETLRRTVHAVLGELAQAVAGVRATGQGQRLTVSTTVSFASLWLIPRLPSFRRLHPHTEVFVSAENRLIDLDRGEVDLAVRFTAAEPAPAGAVRLFGERLVPVASPRLLRRNRIALRRPEDLSPHVLLHLEDPFGRAPWVNWSIWLASAGVPDLVPSGNLRFSQYDQLLQAVLDGQGVGLGRTPLIDRFIKSGALVTPFPRRYDVPRAYFAVAAAHAALRPEVKAFLDWITAEASRDSLQPAPAPGRSPSKVPAGRVKG